MLINLYGNIVNPESIINVELSTGNDVYMIYLPAPIGTSSVQKNWLEISRERVQTVDELSFHEPDKLYMMKIINKLESLAKTSAEGVNNNGRTESSV